MALNLLGEELEPCSFDPLTGYFRDGCCNTGSGDVGVHTVCVVVTEEFLALSAHQETYWQASSRAIGFRR